MTELEVLTKMQRYSQPELEGYRDYWKRINEKKAELLSDYQPESDLQILYLRQNTEEEPDAIRLIQQPRYQQPVLHKHAFFEMIYVYEGEMQLQVEGRNCLLFAGDVCLIQPGVFHQLEVNSQSLVLLLQIQRDLCRELFLPAFLNQGNMAAFLGDSAYDGSRKETILYQTGSDRRLREPICRICLETMEQAPYYQEMIRIQLMLFLGIMVREYDDTAVLHASRSVKGHQDYDILRYIETNFRTVTLAELSEAFHFSGHYLSQKIRNLTGMSFMEYVQELKMKNAVEMLTTTNIKIKDISEALGYNNQEHYIRTFRRHFGKTPTQYRRDHFKVQ